MKTNVKFAVASLFVLGVAAAQTSDLQQRLEIYEVTTVKVDGKEQEQVKKSAGLVEPGMVIELRTISKNIAKAAIKNAVIGLNIDRNQEYIAGSATKEGKIEFSFDNGASYGVEPLKRKITVTENGKTVTKEVVVKPEEYTNVKWSLASVDANMSKTLGVRVKIK